jgi:capsid protein
MGFFSRLFGGDWASGVGRAEGAGVPARLGVVGVQGAGLPPILGVGGGVSGSDGRGVAVAPAAGGGPVVGPVNFGVAGPGGGGIDAARDSVVRSQVAWFPMDSTREVSVSDRQHLVKAFRSLRNNLPFVRGIVQTAVELAIGWGLQPMPKSGDVLFNARAKDYWARHTGKRRKWDVSKKHNHAMMQRMVLGETQVDGEMFLLKVGSEFGYRQRQVFKTEQVGNAGQERKEENWVDGMLLNAVHAPVRYKFLQKPMPGSSPVARLQRRFVTREAEEVLHVYERERALQSRGLPWGYSGMNDLIDVLDLEAFEKVAHKINAAIFATLQTKDGSMPESMRTVMSEIMTPGQVPSGTTQGAPRFLDIHGSMIPLFKEGDAIRFNTGGRSVLSLEQFVGLMFNMFSLGYGLPANVLWGMSGLGGASVRFATDMVGRFAERVQMMMIEDLCQPDWEDVIGHGLLAWVYPAEFPGVEPLEPPKGWVGWDKVEWRGPRNITVDKGRDGRLFLELKRAGWMTDEQWWSDLGEDPDEMMVKPNEEMERKLADWVRRGLPEEMFWKRELGQNVQVTVNEPGGGAETGTGTER